MNIMCLFGGHKWEGCTCSLCGKSCDINKLNSKFIKAVQSCNILELEKLVSKGADINVKADDGTTALLYAAQNANMKLAQALLAKEGIDVNAKANNGATALMIASQKRCVEIVQVLLSKEGIEVNAKCDAMQGFTSLHFASQNGNIDIVKALLAKEGIDISAETNYGSTALMIALKSLHLEIFRLLLAVNDPNPLSFMFSK